MPLDVPPPRCNRFGLPLVLSRVHWVRPELVAKVKYLTWTEDNLLRQLVYEGLEDKPGNWGTPFTEVSEAIAASAFADVAQLAALLTCHRAARSEGNPMSGAVILCAGELQKAVLKPASAMEPHLSGECVRGSKKGGTGLTRCTSSAP